MARSAICLAWIIVLISVAVGAAGVKTIGLADFDAAMPILERGRTQVALSSGPSGLRLSVDRVVTSHIHVTGIADGRGGVDLRLRLLAPLELAPAFLAVELAPTRVAGLMTVYFGPVSFDLGRSWFDRARWVAVQCVVDPRCTLVISAVQRLTEIAPSIGCRLFPEASGRWEIGVLLGVRRIGIWLGGVL
jgi:hypothetical protein